MHPTEPMAIPALVVVRAPGGAIGLRIVDRRGDVARAAVEHYRRQRGNGRHTLRQSLARMEERVQDTLTGFLFGLGFAMGLGVIWTVGTLALLFVPEMTSWLV